MGRIGFRGRFVKAAPSVEQKRNRERKTPMTTPLPDQETVTLEGLILPARWGETGDVVGLKIATFDEGEYAILNDALGEKLSQYLRRKVMARGHLVGDAPENKGFKVLSFHVVSSEKSDVGE
jgi:hypothetical protein